MKFLQANRIAPDGTPRSAASHLGLYCLPMSHKGTPGLNELTSITCWEAEQNHEYICFANHGADMHVLVGMVICVNHVGSEFFTTQ